MNRRHGAVLALMVLLGACGSGAQTASTPVATETSAVATTAATTTAAPSSTSANTTANTEGTTVAPDTTLPAADLSIADLPTTGPCALGDPPEGGEVTFVVGSRLYGIGTDAVVCLADLQGRSPTWISWSPDGDEVLVGSDMLLRADGTFSSTGYFADNTNVRWSAPTGKALIAPKAATGELIWRNAHDNAQRIDVSFADDITAAAYHPAGKHIAAAGVGRDGLGPGLFVATNRGANAIRIGSIETDGMFTDVGWDSTGNSVVFVHSHADGHADIHRFDVTAGLLATVAESDAPVEHLTVSPVDPGDVAWSREFSTVNWTTHIVIGDSTEEMVAAPVSETRTDPLGWLPGHRLLVSVQPAMATPSDSTFDLWEWSPTGTTHVIDGVTAAATRTVHGPYSELTLIPGSGFG